MRYTAKNMGYGYDISRLRHWVEFTEPLLNPPNSYPEILITVVALLTQICNDPKTTNAEIEKLLRLFAPFEVDSPRDDYRRLHSVLAKMESRAGLEGNAEACEEETDLFIPDLVLPED